MLFLCAFGQYCLNYQTVNKYNKMLRKNKSDLKSERYNSLDGLRAYAALG